MTFQHVGIILWILITVLIPDVPKDVVERTRIVNINLAFIQQMPFVNFEVLILD